MGVMERDRVGEEKQGEVVVAKKSSHKHESECDLPVHSKEVYRNTREEQEERTVKEYQEAINDAANVQPPERHKPRVSPARLMEAHDRVHTTSVLREPTFTNNCTESGKETGEKAGEPKAIDRDCGIGGSLGDSRIGYICQLWVTAVQYLVEDQGRLLLIIRI